MLNFKKELNLRVIALAVSGVFLFNNILYALDSLRVPMISQRSATGNSPIGQQALGSNATLGRRIFLSLALLAGPALVTEAAATIESLFQIINIEGFGNSYTRDIEPLAEADGEKQEQRLKNLVQGVYSEYALYRKGSPGAFVKTLKDLVGSFDREEGIFERIRKDGKEQKNKLVLLLISCTAKSELAYRILIRIGIKNLRGALGFEHAFNIIPLKSGRFLLIDFVWGVVRIIELDGGNSYYEKKEGYYGLKMGQRVSPEKLHSLRQKLNSITNSEDRLSFVQNLLENELMNLLYPFIHIAPEDSSDNGLIFAIKLERGFIYHALGDYRSAEREYKDSLQLNSACAETHGNLANIYFESGRIDEAFSEYTTAINLNPYNPIHYSDFGRLYSRLNRWEKAVKLFEQSLSIDSVSPGVESTYAQLGDAYLNLGKYIEAETAYRKAMEIAPKDAPILYKIGQVKYLEGEHKEAIKWFDKANKLDKYAWQIYYARGIVYYKLNNEKKAIADLREAVEKAREQNIDLLSNPDFLKELPSEKEKNTLMRKIGNPGVTGSAAAAMAL